MKYIIALLILCSFTSCRPVSLKSDHLRIEQIKIAYALWEYSQAAGEFPSSQQGLGVLVARPSELAQGVAWHQIMNEIPKDAWGQEYQYEVISHEQVVTFEIRSLGVDCVRSDDDKVAVFIGSAEGIECLE